MGVPRGMSPTNAKQNAATGLAQLELNMATASLKEELNGLVERHQAEINATLANWMAKTSFTGNGMPLCIKCWAEDRAQRPASPDRTAVNSVISRPAMPRPATADPRMQSPVQSFEYQSRPGTAQLSRPNTANTAASAHAAARAAAERAMAEPQAPVKVHAQAPAANIPGMVESDEESSDAKGSDEEVPKAIDVPVNRSSTQNYKRKSSVFANVDESELKRGPIATLINSKFYEWASIVLILANSSYIGIQTQFLAERAQYEANQGHPINDELPDVMKDISFVFNILFTIDLVLRWTGTGFMDFIFCEDMNWNLFDIFIVGTGLLDIVFYIMAAISSGEASPAVTSVARVLRLVRVAKMLRIIRVLKFFRELRMMIFSILNSMLSLVWVLLILALIFYLFGIVFTNGVIQTLETPEKWLDPDNEELIASFGTLATSVITLFMAMSGGNDWGGYYEVLGNVSGVHQMFFLAFIFVSIFAVVNIVTGVFVDSAMTANNMDQAMVVQEEMEKKKKQLDLLRSVFEELDEEGDGIFDSDEFEERLQDERVQAYFTSMKLDVSDAKTLFKLLDDDNSNSISIDEFVDGVHGLMGEASSLDSKIMQYEIKYLKEGIDQV
eukprot:CAMPEP_0197632456 /NCGR_PEP_ID=MMETSP1338-20131121/9197_1 /TAXON_ID=43686 ORGANISM="Pelagodinium beii, Strain RCC1491" /NCGR_SAMPLE_ID=MMETSP1338 /ASSEMBLY_ACC=CAM_ASM_000754 /LENGTH=612 /DNA_ID=CAMNT_0043204021 /DNA_START=76 /DNA_END=1911 /DNA_ORIENTATION=+